MKKQVVVTSAVEGDVLEIGPTRNLVRLSGNATGGRLGAIEFVLPAGFGGPPPHRHREIDHFFYVIAGRVEMTIEGRAVTVEAGGSAFIPAGTAHSFGTGTHPARLLEIDTPRTLDAYFAELAEAMPPGSSVDPQLIAEIQRRHDTEPR